MGYGDAGIAFQNLWTEDYIFLHVTDSEHHTSFFYNFPCIQYAQSTLTSRWYPLTGWGLVSHSLAIVPQDPGPYQVRSTAFQRMANDNFCPGGGNTTFTDYVPNEIRLFADGWVSFAWTPPVYGGCSWLLTRHRFAQFY